MNYYSSIKGINFDQAVKENKIKYIEESDYESKCYKYGNLTFNTWNDGSIFLLALYKKQINEYETFLSECLSPGHWNEYIEQDVSVVDSNQGNICLIFKLMDGTIKKYILDNNNEKEILELIYEFDKVKYESVREIFLFNSFYRFYDAMKLEKKDINKDFVLESSRNGVYINFLKPFKDNYNEYQEKIDLIYTFDSEVGSGGLLNYFFQNGLKKTEALLLFLQELKLDEIYNLVYPAFKKLPSNFFEMENVYLDEEVEKLSEEFNEIDSNFYEYSLIENENNIVYKYISDNIDKFYIKK